MLQNSYRRPIIPFKTVMEHLLKYYKSEMWLFNIDSTINATIINPLNSIGSHKSWLLGLGLHGNIYLELRLNCMATVVKFLLRTGTGLGLNVHGHWSLPVMWDWEWDLMFYYFGLRLHGYNSLVLLLEAGTAWPIISFCPITYNCLVQSFSDCREQWTFCAVYVLSTRTDTCSAIFCKVHRLNVWV